MRCPQHSQTGPLAPRLWPHATTPQPYLTWLMPWGARTVGEAGHSADAAMPPQCDLSCLFAYSHAPDCIPFQRMLQCMVLYPTVCSAPQCSAIPPYIIPLCIIQLYIVSLHISCRCTYNVSVSYTMYMTHCILCHCILFTVYRPLYIIIHRISSSTVYRPLYIIHCNRTVIAL
jgi:hypothetical protein